MKNLFQHVTLALALPLFAGCAREQVWRSQNISLQGSHSVEVMPDRVVWDVELHCVAASIEAAHQRVLDATVRLNARGKEIGVPEGAFEAKGVRQGTEWEWVEGRRTRSSQYFSERTLTVTISDLALYAAISERLFLDDALVVTGVRFSNSKRDEAYREALDGALADAAAKAKFIAEKAGMTLVGIQSVRVVEERYAPVPAYAMDAGQKSSAALPAMRPETVTAAVDVSYEIK